MENSELLEKLGSKLVQKLLPFARTPGRHGTTMAGFEVTRFDEPTQSDSCFYEPSIGLVLQGHKNAVIGNERFSYGKHFSLVNGVAVPSINSIIAASRDTPFLAISLVVDHQLVTELCATIPQESTEGAGPYSGVSVARVAPDVLEAFFRLADILGNPEQIAVLAPLLIREIHYRVLRGPQGGCLRMISSLGSQGGQIARAITWLRENMSVPFHVDDLAAMVGMAKTTFHRHFKQITSMSPIQYQKRLRLYEAQRLMLAEEMDATSASLAVGYESPSQFNREYKRLFGEAPHRDVSKMRKQQVEEGVGQSFSG